MRYKVRKRKDVFKLCTGIKLLFNIVMNRQCYLYSCTEIYSLPVSAQ